MVAFEVQLNGKKICRAGVAADFGVLDVIVSWARFRPRRQNGRITEELRLEVGGLDSSGPHTGQHSKWGRRALRVGDRLSVAIVEAKRVDAPKKRYRLQPSRKATR